MALKIEYIAVEDLRAYEKNARTHSPDQVAQIIDSINEFGFTNPVLIDEDNELIAGHGRTQAAQAMGLEEVPAIRLTGLSDEQKRALRIADNKLALNAGWNFELLAEEIQELDLDGFDTSVIGFSDSEIDALLEGDFDALTAFDSGAGNDEVEPEEYEPVDEEHETPEPQPDPVSVLGDVWVLGDHRVMCGDSTSMDAVDKLMGGVKADVLFTDPPYGIDFAPQRGTHGKILNDSLGDGEFSTFLDSFLSAAIAHMKPDTYAFIWTGWSKIGAFESAIKKFFKIQAMHIWVKNNFGIGYYSRPKHEPFYLCLNGKPAYPSKAPADVWEAAKVHKTVHSCEKPVSLIVDILDTYHKNSVTLDLFGGSGSTLIACENTGRKCRMMELDPRYVDVIVKRWQNHTGKQAVLESTGQTFDEVMAERDAA